MGLTRLPPSPTPPHAPKAEEDEGYTEDLTHVEKHSVLEINLILLGVFDKYASCEDEEETKTEEEACTYLLRLMAIDPPMDEKEYSVA